MMRVLFCGDSPTVSTGFARCTKATCVALHEAGHEVHVLGISYYGDPHDRPYQIYPCFQPLDRGFDMFGVDRIPVLAGRIKPDIVVLLNDPWNIPAYLDALNASEIDAPVIGWLAVDGKNQKGEPLNRLDHVVTWTEWAGRELETGGYVGTRSVVPLGVDRGIFRPINKDEAKSKVIPQGLKHDNPWVVGVVGRNQPRKRLDLTIEYFAEWVHSRNVDDAYLYLHVAPTGERGCDLRSLIKYHGLAGKVILAQPDVGRGIPGEQMPWTYSAFDCYWTTTQGEGWGLPALEAMACGTPCIVPDWSALGDWPGDAAIKVPCTSTALTAPLNGNPYTVGGVPDKEASIDALDRVYRSEDVRRRLIEKGIRRAAELGWGESARAMVSVIESVVRGRVIQRKSA